MSALERAFLTPAGLPDWSAFFSQVVVVRGREMATVYVAGQVGVDDKKALAGDGSLAAQARKACDNLAHALASVGGVLADVTMLTIYVVGYEPKHADVIGEVLGGRFEKGRLPACSLIGVQALALPEFLIEVEAVAVIEAR